MRRSIFFLWLILVPGLVAAQEQDPFAEPASWETVDGYDDADPWEGFNRKVYVFNDAADRYVLKPVAQTYRNWVPGPARRMVGNFLSNLEEPISLVNNLLQLKGEAALTTAGRLVFNTTFGLGGLFDVATGFELPEQDEDFGQTLGYWGLDTGPYLVLPFLGPSTLRDSTRFLADSQIPNGYDLVEYPEVYLLYGLKGVNTRAALIPAEEALIGEDRYRAIRNAYLQRRHYEVRDGVVEDPFANDDFMLEDF